MTRVSDAKLGTLIPIILALSACGPDEAETGGSTVTWTGSEATSTGGVGSTFSPTGSSTGVLEPCSQVHEGDLDVTVDTDLASLADLGRVTGTLTITMGPRDQRDLEFLKCLHTVDISLIIDQNALLESTEGLASLQSAKNVSFTDNPNLRVVTDLDKIEELSYLAIHGNLALEDIQLDSLKHVRLMYVGQCIGPKASAKHLALGGLSGFDGLTSVTRLSVDGNEVLTSADLLDAIASNGALAPIGVATIRLNPLLSETAVHAQLDILGVTERDVCGNAGGDLECDCPADE